MFNITVSSLKGTTPYPVPPKIKVAAPGMTDANGTFHQGLRGFLFFFFPVADGWYTPEKTNMTLGNPLLEDVFNLLKLGIFQCHVRFQECKSLVFC